MQADEHAIIEMVFNLFHDEFVLFDVGAAEGAYTDCVREHCGHVEAHLFEPRSGAAMLLAEKYSGDLRTSVINTAVGNIIERTKLTLGTDDICQSHLRGVFEGEEWEEVSVTTIDNYLLNYKVEDDIFLKIDTEGYEVPVIKGATHALAEEMIQAVQFEYGGTWGPGSPWSERLQDAIDWLPSAFTIYEYRDGHMRPIRDASDDYEYRNYLAVRSN
jgi:FkbM family methyltransferase